MGQIMQCSKKIWKTVIIKAIFFLYFRTLYIWNIPRHFTAPVVWLSCSLYFTWSPTIHPSTGSDVYPGCLLSPVSFITYVTGIDMDSGCGHSQVLIPTLTTSTLSLLCFYRTSSKSWSSRTNLTNMIFYLRRILII